MPVFSDSQNDKNLPLSESFYNSAELVEQEKPEGANQ